jgi:hypothetical protein
MHVILFSPHADRLREFLADLLGLRSVDAGAGRPIYAAPPTEIAVHPTDDQPEHQVYLMCDDLDAVATKLPERGIRTDGPNTDREWGLMTSVVLTGGQRIGLYAPRHVSPFWPTAKSPV